jgi:hypothetical protein
LIIGGSGATTCCYYGIVGSCQLDSSGSGGSAGSSSGGETTYLGVSLCFFVALNGNEGSWNSYPWIQTLFIWLQEFTPAVGFTSPTLLNSGGAFLVWNQPYIVGGVPTFDSQGRIVGPFSNGVPYGFLSCWDAASPPFPDNYLGGVNWSGPPYPPIIPAWPGVYWDYFLPGS